MNCESHLCCAPSGRCVEDASCSLLPRLTWRDGSDHTPSGMAVSKTHTHSKRTQTHSSLTVCVCVCLQAGTAHVSHRRQLLTCCARHERLHVEVSRQKTRRRSFVAFLSSLMLMFTLLFSHHTFLIVRK